MANSGSKATRENKKTSTEEVTESAPEEEEEVIIESSEEETTADAKSKNTFKRYHVSKRAKDNKWQVKLAGTEKPLKLFNTKVEAVEYAKKVAANQEGGIIIHPSKGKNKGKFSSK